jgi:hypothetical protein
MTRIAGYELVGSPCCQTIYAKARFSSVNFSSSAFWTDGRRENSLMPNDGGLRKCKCGTYFLLRDCTTTGLNAGENPNFPEHVYESDLPNAIQTASSENVELAARRTFWMYLNDSYREKYKSHREAEEASTQLVWASEWHKANPDNRNTVRKIIDVLLLRKRQSAPPAKDKPFTFPDFRPTEIQIENMLRLVKLVTDRPDNFSTNYPVELAELYRELGMFNEAISLLKKISEENHDKVTDLLTQLSVQKISAPIRYKH